MRSGPSVNARVGFRLRRRVGHGKTKRVNDEPLMAYVALGANLAAAAGQGFEPTPISKFSKKSSIFSGFGSFLNDF